MYKLFIKIKHDVDKFNVAIDKYDFNDGKLVESRSFNNVKQINLSVKQITISKQLSNEPFILIVESKKPVIDLISGSILIVKDEEV